MNLPRSSPRSSPKASPKSTATRFSSTAPASFALTLSHIVSSNQNSTTSLSARESTVVVEYGLVRLDFRYMPHNVRDTILQEHAPLGSILINNTILRRIQPRWYLKFPQTSQIMSWFGCQPSQDLFGRL